MNTNTHDEIDGGELLDTLRLTEIKPRTEVGGTWVTGTIAGHNFQALIFPEHAEVAAYELDDSRFSKLWLQDQETDTEVANFDRGWDVQPTNAIAQRIVDLLAAGLAEVVFGH